MLFWAPSLKNLGAHSKIWGHMPLGKSNPVWPIQNDAKTPEIWLRAWHMGTQLRALNKSFLMNTNMTGFRWFTEMFASLCFGAKLSQHKKGKTMSRRVHWRVSFLSGHQRGLVSAYKTWILWIGFASRSVVLHRACSMLFTRADWVNAVPFSLLLTHLHLSVKE